MSANREPMILEDRDCLRSESDCSMPGMMVEGNRKSILIERIPEDELPIDCQFLMACCGGIAAVYVTSDLNPRRRAVCVPHGNFMMAEWITTL